MINDNNDKIIYLTFDDGPSKNSEKILDILKIYNIKATFFVCANTTDYGKDIYKRIVSEGHSIGNHSYSHDYSKIYSSEEAFLKDLKRLEELLYDTVGIRPKIIRFPGGSNTTIPKRYNDSKFMERLTTLISLEGYQYFDWNVSSTDASKAVQDKEIIIESVLLGVKKRSNAIVLFHDSWIKTTTVEALPQIIEELIKMGYNFDSLSEEAYWVRFD